MSTTTHALAVVAHQLPALKHEIAAVPKVARAVIPSLKGYAIDAGLGAFVTWLFKRKKKPARCSPASSFTAPIQARERRYGNLIMRERITHDREYYDSS